MANVEDLVTKKEEFVENGFSWKSSEDEFITSGNASLELDVDAAMVLVVASCFGFAVAFMDDDTVVRAFLRREAEKEEDETV